MEFEPPDLFLRYSEEEGWAPETLELWDRDGHTLFENEYGVSKICLETQEGKRVLTSDPFYRAVEVDESHKTPVLDALEKLGLRLRSRGISAP